MTHTSTEQERAEWSKSFESYWKHGQVKAYKIRDTYGYTKNVWRKAWLAFEEQAARSAQVVLQEPAFESQAFGLHGPTGPITKFYAAAPQPPEAACNPSMQPLIESRDVVSTGSGVTVTRCNLSGAGRAALQSKADHIPNAGKMVAAPVQLPEPPFWYCESKELGAIWPIGRTTKKRESAFKDGYFNQQALYTEHQVRQLLADHGIKAIE